MGIFDSVSSLAQQRIARQHELQDRAIEARANLVAEERAFTLALRQDRRASYPEVLKALKRYEGVGYRMMGVLGSVGGGMTTSEYIQQLADDEDRGQAPTQDQQAMSYWIDKWQEAAEELESAWVDAELVASDEVRLAYMQMEIAEGNFFLHGTSDEDERGTVLTSAISSLRDAMRENLTLGQ